MNERRLCADCALPFGATEPTEWRCPACQERIDGNAEKRIREVKQYQERIERLVIALLHGGFSAHMAVTRAQTLLEQISKTQPPSEEKEA